MSKRYLILLLALSFFGTTLFAADGDESEIVALAEEALVAANDNNLGPTADGFLPDTDFGPEGDDFVDPRVLRDFIESRGLIECRKKSGTLTIAGDVRARWVSTGEKVDGDKKRGTGTPTAINIYKSEVNLFLDYVTKCSWVSTKLRWANFDGKDGGTATKVNIDRAFIGYDIRHIGDEDFYIEIGRSRLEYMFESRLEFSSTFDGIHLFYTKPIPCVGILTAHGGPFIVDSFTNHYAWIAELGVTKWRGGGWGFKYSIINWQRNAPTKYFGNLDKEDIDKLIADGKLDPIKLLRDNPRYRFLISQMLIGHERKVNFLKCKTLYVYGAVLVNHDAKKSESTNDEYLNHAWYAGFTLGKLCKACDWSVDINYQSVQAQAIPEFDLSGIGHGNAQNSLISDFLIQGAAPRGVRGFTNYKGWQVSLLYALTDTLTIRSKAVWATPRNKNIGGSYFYKSTELSVIYAF